MNQAQTQTASPGAAADDDDLPPLDMAEDVNPTTVSMPTKVQALKTSGGGVFVSFSNPHKGKAHVSSKCCGQRLVLPRNSIFF